MWVGQDVSFLFFSFSFTPLSTVLLLNNFCLKKCMSYCISFRETDLGGDALHCGLSM